MSENQGDANNSGKGNDLRESQPAGNSRDAPAAVAAPGQDPGEVDAETIEKARRACDILRVCTKRLETYVDARHPDERLIREEMRQVHQAYEHFAGYKKLYAQDSQQRIDTAVTQR